MSRAAEWEKRDVIISYFDDLASCWLEFKESDGLIDRMDVCDFDCM